MIRWGIVGCGDVTEVKSGPALQQAHGSALVAVMRRTGRLAEEYARRHNVPRWYDDADALVNDAQVDAVYVATPPGSHLQCALKVCAAGKPAYVEKPMARSYAECTAMKEAFARARLPLFVAYYRRGLARFMKARDMIIAGRIGQITSVSYRYVRPPIIDYLAGGSHALSIDPLAREALETGDPSVSSAGDAELPWRLRAEAAGGGLFLDLGCHTLDMLDFLLGPLEHVKGGAANLVSRYEVEDTVAMTFRAANGALGVASWSFAGSHSDDLIEVSGTRGFLRLSTFGNEPVQLQSAGGLEAIDLPNPPHIQQPLIQTIVDELSGKTLCPSTGESASRTSRVIDEVLAGYYGGREDAFWQRPATWPGRRVGRT